MARKSTNYTDEFKKQMVALKQNGKSTADISREYDIWYYVKKKYKLNSDKL